MARFVNFGWAEGLNGIQTLYSPGNDTERGEAVLETLVRGDLAEGIRFKSEMRRKQTREWTGIGHSVIFRFVAGLTPYIVRSSSSRHELPGARAKGAVLGLHARVKRARFFKPN